MLDELKAVVDRLDAVKTHATGRRVRPTPLGRLFLADLCTGYICL